MKHAYDYQFPMTRNDLAKLPMEERIYFVDRLLEAEQLDLIPTGDFYALSDIDQRAVWAMVSPRMMAYAKHALPKKHLLEHGFPKARKWFFWIWAGSQMVLVILGGMATLSAMDYQESETSDTAIFVLFSAPFFLLAVSSYVAIILDMLMLGWAWVNKKK